MNTNMHHVLIVGNGSLLDEGVESILKRQGDVRVSGIAYADDTAFLQDVSNMRPDVILLNERSPLTPQRILELLADNPMLATLQVIVVRPDDNTIDVYERQRVTARRVADLVHLIRRERA